MKLKSNTCQHGFNQMYLFTDLSVSATCTVRHPLIFSSQLLLGGQYSISRRGGGGGWSFNCTLWYAPLCVVVHCIVHCGTLHCVLCYMHLAL